MVTKITFIVRTLQEAMDDGELIDVTKVVNRLGVRLPTVVTAALWAACVGSKDSTLMDHPGLIRLLREFIAVLEAVPPTSHRVTFRATPWEMGAEKVDVIAHLGPDGFGAPYVTLMLPQDD